MNIKVYLIIVIILLVLILILINSSYRNVSHFTITHSSTAMFYSPIGITIDNSGNLFICDMNNSIRKIDIKTGIVTTFAGPNPTNGFTPGKNGFKDGSLNVARFNNPRGITIDKTGNLFICDSENNSIRKIDNKTGIVTTIAGPKPTDDITFGKAGFKDGKLNDARFNYPSGLTIDNSGNLFVCDSGNHSIRKIDIINSIVTTIAGPKPTDGITKGESGFKDGSLNDARFYQPWGITIDNSGNLFVCDNYNNSIRKIDIKNNIVSTIAGPKPTNGKTFGENGFKDGNLNDARFSSPSGITIDNNGNLFITNNYIIRKIDIINNKVTTIAGPKPMDGKTKGDIGFKDGKLNDARFYQPAGITIDKSGILFVCDNHSIRKIDIKNDNVSTIAGSMPSDDSNTLGKSGFKDG